MKKSDGEFIKIKDLNDEKTDSKKNIKSINNNSKKINILQILIIKLIKN